jgi:hypothetical protein
MTLNGQSRQSRCAHCDSPVVVRDGKALSVIDRSFVGERDRLVELAQDVVRAWTRWIDTRSDEWMNAPDDPAEDALDNAVGDLGRLAWPEHYA